jgi:hypothetical protein
VTQEKKILILKDAQAKRQQLIEQGKKQHKNLIDHAKKIIAKMIENQQARLKKLQKAADKKRDMNFKRKQQLFMMKLQNRKGCHKKNQPVYVPMGNAPDSDPSSDGTEGSQGSDVTVTPVIIPGILPTNKQSQHDLFEDCTSSYK